MSRFFRAQIAEQFGVHSARIRQILEKALRKLRLPSRIQVSKDAWELLELGEAP